jgi:hypothetical protein
MAIDAPFLYRLKQRWNTTSSNLCGPQINYFCPYYQPRYSTGDEAVARIRALKRILSEDRSYIKGIIEHALIGLESWNYGGVRFYAENFDVVVPLPSQFPLVKLITDIMVERSKVLRKTTVSNIADSILSKKTFDELLIDENRLDWEMNERTDALVEHYAKTVRCWLGEMFEVKRIQASLRRYIYNFLRLNTKHNLYQRLVEAKKILLVDDTIGQGVTLSEAARVIREVNKTASIDAFTLVHDFPCATNSIKYFANE